MPVSPVDPPPLLSDLLTHRNVAMGAGRNVAVYRGQRSFVETWNAETDFDAVRLIYATTRGGGGFGIQAARLAAVPAPWFEREAAAEPRFEPVGFGGLAPGQPVAFASLPDVPDQCDVWTPGLSVSDFAPTRSLARADGGPGCLVEIRTLIGGEQSVCGPYTAHRSGIDASDTHILTGRHGEKLFGFADLVTAAPRISAADLDLGTRGQGAVYAVQFRSHRLGATIQAVGDSIVQGGGFDAAPYVSGHFSFAHLACAAVSRAARPVALLQSGVGGEPSLDFFRSAAVDLALGPVAIALIQTWSGNDVDRTSSAEASVTSADAAWGRAMHYGALIRHQGGVPVFLSAVPQAPKMGSAGAEAARRSSVARCALLAACGHHTLDLDEVLGDGSNFVNYKPSLGCDDNIHPNAAGNHAISAALAPILRGILDRASDHAGEGQEPAGQLARIVQDRT